jgi:hypothetical protein
MRQEPVTMTHLKNQDKRKVESGEFDGYALRDLVEVRSGSSRNALWLSSHNITILTHTMLLTGTYATESMGRAVRFTAAAPDVPGKTPSFHHGKLPALISVAMTTMV